MVLLPFSYFTVRGLRLGRSRQTNHQPRLGSVRSEVNQDGGFFFRKIEESRFHHDVAVFLISETPDGTLSVRIDFAAKRMRLLSFLIVEGSGKDAFLVDGQLNDQAGIFLTLFGCQGVDTQRLPFVLPGVILTVIGSHSANSNSLLVILWASHVTVAIHVDVTVTVVDRTTWSVAVVIRTSPVSDNPASQHIRRSRLPPVAAVEITSTIVIRSVEVVVLIPAIVANRLLPEILVKSRSAILISVDAGSNPSSDLSGVIPLTQLTLSKVAPVAIAEAVITIPVAPVIVIPFSTIISVVAITTFAVFTSQAITETISWSAIFDVVAVAPVSTISSGIALSWTPVSLQVVPQALRTIQIPISLLTTLTIATVHVGTVSIGTVSVAISGTEFRAVAVAFATFFPIHVTTLFTVERTSEI